MKPRLALLPATLVLLCAGLALAFLVTLNRPQLKSVDSGTAEAPSTGTSIGEPLTKASKVTVYETYAPREYVPPPADSGGIGCTSGYFLQGGALYFGSKNCGQIEQAQVINADPTTFRIQSSNYDHDRYGLDQYHVFYGAQMIPGLDPATFRVITWSGFVADKDSVYAYGEVMPIEGADAATFENVGENQLIYRDKNRVYCNGTSNGERVLPGADPMTIEPILSTFGYSTAPYAKDKDHVFNLWKCAVVFGANPSDYPQ